MQNKTGCNWLSNARRQAQAWHEERRRSLTKEAATLTNRETDLSAKANDLGAQLTAQEAQVEVARRQLAELGSDDLVAEVARLRAEAAVSAGQLQSYQARARELGDAQAERGRELANKEARIGALAAEQTEASQAIERQNTVASALTAEIEGLAAFIEPAESRLATLETQQRQSDVNERTLREQMRHAQMRQNQADLALQRAHDEVTHLRGEIEKDLGLVALVAPEDVNSDEMGDTQPPLPLNGMVTHLPIVVMLPDGLDADVRNLRGRSAGSAP